jgi:hypothetical protein
MQYWLAFLWGSDNQTAAAENLAHLVGAVNF